MALVYTNNAVEDLVWSAIQDSRCSQDFLDYLQQFYDPFSSHWLKAVTQAVATFCPTDPRGERQTRFYPRAFDRLSKWVHETNDTTAQGIGYLHLAKMLHLGMGVAADRDQSITCYKRAMALGEIRAFINCGAHFDGPNATPEDLEYAHDLFARALDQGEPMGLARIADRIENKNDPRRYELYLQAAEMGLPYGLYKVGGAHYFGQLGQPEDPSLGLSWLQRAARADWAGACEVLGWHYEKEGTKDPELSWEWQMQGTRLGSAACMHAIGLKLLLGVGRDADTAQALHWLHRGAVLGDDRAQFRVGQQHLISERAQDHVVGLAWLKLAAAQGHLQAAWRAAMAYRDGTGCEPNPVESSRYCEIAARAGLPDAQGQLGLNYWSGYGVEKNAQKAHEWLSLCALQGEARGMYLLGLATQNGVGCEPDTEAALQLYQQAAEKGELDAIHQIAECFYFGDGKPKDRIQAVLWYQRAAAKGHAKSMTDLGRLLYQGEGVLSNYEEAFKWFEKAALLDYPLGMYLLALMYDQGDGVEANEELCRRWMSRSAMLGHQPAKDWMRDNLPATPLWLEHLVQQASQPNASGSAEQQPNS